MAAATKFRMQVCKNILQSLDQNRNRQSFVIYQGARSRTTVFLLFKDEMSEKLQTELQEKWQDFIASLSRHIQDNTI